MKVFLVLKIDRRKREQKIINKETSTISTRRSLKSINLNINRKLFFSTRFNERFARKR